VKTFEDYEAETALKNISPQELNALAINDEGSPPINAEAFFY